MSDNKKNAEKGDRSEVGLSDLLCAQKATEHDFSHRVTQELLGWDSSFNDNIFKTKFIRKTKNGLKKWIFKKLFFREAICCAFCEPCLERNKRMSKFKNDWLLDIIKDLRDANNG